MLKSALSQHDQMQMLQRCKQRAGCSRRECSCAHIVPDMEGNIAALMLLLFSIGALFFASNANEGYDTLPPNFKNGVDRVTKRFNARSGLQDLFLYFRGILMSDIEGGDKELYNYYHFYLKATNCSKGTVDTTACHLSDDGALIDCAMCYRTVREKIQQSPKPYFKCINKTLLTQRMKMRHINHCNRMGSVTGAPDFLALPLNPLMDY